MSVLCPTPREYMLDRQGRPYFLWDTDLTLERFETLLASGEPALRAHVFQFVGLDDIRTAWTSIRHQLGRTREFWTWWLTLWGVIADDGE